MSDIQHRAANHCFVLMHEGAEAVLRYQLQPVATGGMTIDFNSTYVPPEYRGKGLAEKLVRAGIAWAKAQGYELHASCWYAAKFIR